MDIKKNIVTLISMIGWLLLVLVLLQGTLYIRLSPNPQNRYAANTEKEGAAIPDISIIH